MAPLEPEQFARIFSFALALFAADMAFDDTELRKRHMRLFWSLFDCARVTDRLRRTAPK